MNTQAHDKTFRLSFIFWTMVAIHLVTWTLVPVFIRHAVSNDIIEAITWGSQFQWGYDKNPWLPGLLAHLGVLIGGESAIGIYFIQQIFVVIALWSIWRLTTLITKNPAYGLIACMMFEGSVCYTLNIQLYNDNYILLGLWPLSAFLFYKAISETHKTKYWILLAITLGLSTMAKYDTVILPALYGLFLLFNKSYRHLLKSAAPWLALILYCIILLPNLIWLTQHQFISLHYAFVERAHYENQTYLNHVVHNIGFIGKTLLNFLPALVLLLAGLSYQQRQRQHAQERGFVFLIAFGPILTLLSIALLMGLNLANEWGMVLMSFWGTFLLYYFQPSISKTSLKRFIIMIYIVLIGWPLGYILISLKMDTGNYPGPEIANIATNCWHEHFHTPLNYVAGTRYVAGYVGFYSPDHPAVYMEWNHQVSPWININQLKCKGAIFIQDSGHTVMEENFRGMQFPADVIKNFPNLIILKPETLPWFRNHNHHHQLSLLLGLLPPSKQYCVK